MAKWQTRNLEVVVGSNSLGGSTPLLGTTDNNMLYDEIKKIINPLICDNKNTHLHVLNRLEKGLFTRDENPQTHFCVYFLPYNIDNQKVFLVHHKKSGLWIFPGGHIDKGENLIQSLNREINEELGLKEFFKKDPLPFLLTTTNIDNKIQTCKLHFDIWYLVKTDGTNFNIDAQEFYDTKWLTIDEAEKIIINQANKTALEFIKTNKELF